MQDLLLADDAGTARGQRPRLERDGVRGLVARDALPELVRAQHLGRLVAQVVPRRLQRLRAHIPGARLRIRTPQKGSFAIRPLLAARP